MPAGVSWGQYLRFSAAAMLSMFAGAQVVHSFYRPMEDFDTYVKDALEKENALLAEREELRKRKQNEKLHLPSPSTSAKRSGESHEDTETDT